MEKSSGQVVFEAYGDHANWTTFDGRKMPAWTEVGDDVRSHWEHAASTLITEWERYCE